MERNFKQLLENRWNEHYTCLCVGLDPVIEKMPAEFQGFAKSCDAGVAIFSFNRYIIERTHKYVCAYKPQIAFYEQYGYNGLQGLELTINHLRQKYPSIPIIMDAKRCDIGNTSAAYAKGVFDFYKADACTVVPYLGVSKALKPFLDRKDKGIIIMCKTSNPDSGELQDVTLIGSKHYLYEEVATLASKQWNYNNNICLVVGATYPEQAEKIREIVGDDIPFLIPGIGAQGGDIEATVEACQDSKGLGMIINSSRGIIYADDPKTEAKRTMDEINKYR